MIFHHHIKILGISLVGIIAISQAISMDLIVNDAVTEATGFIRIDSPTLGETIVPIKPEVTDSMITGNPITPISQQNIPQSQQDDINLNEDVSGCVDNYFRCCISFWRISKGWFSVGSQVIGYIGSGILIPAMMDISPGYKNAIIISAAVLTFTANLFYTIKTTGIQQIQEHQADLREIIVENHAGTHTTYRPKAVKKMRD